MIKIKLFRLSHSTNCVNSHNLQLVTLAQAHGDKWRWKALSRYLDQKVQPLLLLHTIICVFLIKLAGHVLVYTQLNIKERKLFPMLPYQDHY